MFLWKGKTTLNVEGRNNKNENSNCKSDSLAEMKRAPTRNFQTVKPFERSYEMIDTPLIRPLVTASIVLSTVASYNFFLEAFTKIEMLARKMVVKTPQQPKNPPKNSRKYLHFVFPCIHFARSELAIYGQNGGLHKMNIVFLQMENFRIK